MERTKNNVRSLEVHRSKLPFKLIERALISIRSEECAFKLQYSENAKEQMDVHPSAAFALRHTNASLCNPTRFEQWHVPCLTFPFSTKQMGDPILHACM